MSEEVKQLCHSIECGGTGFIDFSNRQQPTLRLTP